MCDWNLWKSSTTDSKEDSKHESTALMRKYTHEIRNMRYLNTEMLDDIRNMTNDDKFEIILLFNEVVDRLKALIE
jgi:hypothetical protein